MQRILLFNLTQEVYPTPPSSSKKNLCQVSIFSQFYFIPGEQMSTLWANGDSGLKSTTGRKAEEQYSLTSRKKFRQPLHPLQEKIR